MCHVTYECAAYVSAAKIIYDSLMLFFFLICLICFGWW